MSSKTWLCVSRELHARGEEIGRRCVMPSSTARKAVVEAGRKLVESGLIARTWGNVSCRIDETSFVITPSGRGYLALTADDLVQVNFNKQTRDLTYTGRNKPSSEKAIHAEVYKLYPEVNFVIHTHQENASVIAAAGLDAIPIAGSYPALGSEVICAEYALPGTRSLAKKVKTALEKAKGKAVIMKYHGALCFGKDSTEAFRVASELEQACGDFLARYGLDEKVREKAGGFQKESRDYYHSTRSEKGFLLSNGETEIEIPGEGISCAYAEKIPGLATGKPPEEIRIYQEIYKTNSWINHILFKSSPEILAVSHSGVQLKPLLDDFAQIVGLTVKSVKTAPGCTNTAQIAKALKRSSAVLLEGVGALCCGKTKDDAVAVTMILQKNCKTYLGASAMRNGKPPRAINPLESTLMRIVYLKKYAKQAEGDG